MRRPVELPMRPVELDELDEVCEVDVELEESLLVVELAELLTEFRLGVLSCGADAWPVALNGFTATVTMVPTEPIASRVIMDISDSFCNFLDHLGYSEIR